MKLITNEQYELIQNSEMMSAIIDKMMVNNIFYGSLINNKDKIVDILAENGFEINGVMLEMFHQTIDEIRNETQKMIDSILVNDAK